MDRGIRTPLIRRQNLIKMLMNGLGEGILLESVSSFSMATGRLRPGRSSRLERLADRRMMAKATMTRIDIVQCFLGINIFNLYPDLIPKSVFSKLDIFPAVID